MDAACGQSLAPEWLYFSRELPSSSQDKSPTKHHNNDRDRPGRRSFGKQNSYHHLIHLSPSSSHSYSLSSAAASSNWRTADHNPRMLNRSKSSPVFDSKENTNEAPKSPDRSNPSPTAADRHFLSNGVLPVRQKAKLKGKPPLISSRSQPNLFTTDKTTWQQPKFRSPPPSRAPSFLGMSSLIPPLSPASSPSPSPNPSPSLVPTTMAMAVASLPAHIAPTPIVPIPEDLDLEMEKLRTLVPSPSVASAAAPKPPTRLVSTNRKHPKPPGRPEKPATPPPNLLQLRKHTSEPSLLNNPNGTPQSADDLVRKMRLIKQEKAKVALKETIEEQEVVVAKRNNFLMDVFKREKQIQDSAEVENNANGVLDEEVFSPNTAPESNGDTNNPSLPTEDIPLAHTPYNNQQQPMQLPTVEDEERFLRLLGWVPDEEDHVPELDEDEIAEVRLKINSHQQQSSPATTPRNNYSGGMALELGLGRDLMTVAIHQD